MDPLSRLLRGRTRRALLLLLPVAAGFAALLSTLTLGVTAGEAGLLVAAATGLWFWLGTVRTRVEESRQLALTDDLTGLGNRRRLLGDLECAIGEGTDHSPSALAMFDLDGFKAYNDTHGHPAGDALLAQLGTRLAATFAGSGAAYRLGGDEFCVLLHGSPPQLERALTSALEALTDEDADVRPSYGFALLPREARDPSSALRIVDQRMYAQKDGRRASTKRQARDLLLAVLDQHAPDLRAHSDWVSDLARSVGHRLGLSRERIEDVVLAAELHDIGKAVVPRGSSRSPARSTRPNGRSCGGIPPSARPSSQPRRSLRGVARLVRSTHERIDGTGYPDGLAGEDIPLESRIVAVCDAFDAMTSDRAYRPAMSRQEALAELEARAGTQFDPAVVDAARAALEHPATRRRAPEPTAARRAPDLSPVARIQGLVDIIRLVRMRDEPDRLLDEIAGTVGTALGLGTVVINLYRPEWDDFVVCSVHGNAEARETLLGSTYPREWFDPIMDSQFLRRGAYVIEQGKFDWASHLGDRYVPSSPEITIPGAWQPEDELFVPFRHSDGHILGIFSVGDPASGLRLVGRGARRARRRRLTGGRARRGRPVRRQLGPVADRAHAAPLRLVAPHRIGLGRRRPLGRLQRHPVGARLRQGRRSSCATTRSRELPVGRRDRLVGRRRRPRDADDGRRPRPAARSRVRDRGLLPAAARRGRRALLGGLAQLQLPAERLRPERVEPPLAARAAPTDRRPAGRRRSGSTTRATACSRSRAASRRCGSSPTRRRRRSRPHACSRR